MCLKTSLRSPCPGPVMVSSCGAFVHRGSILDRGIACQSQPSPLGTGLVVAPGFACGLNQGCHNSREQEVKSCMSQSFLELTVMAVVVTVAVGFPVECPHAIHGGQLLKISHWGKIFLFLVHHYKKCSHFF